jgi:hypothetical protein
LAWIRLSPPLQLLPTAQHAALSAAAASIVNPAAAAPPTSFEVAIVPGMGGAGHTVVQPLRIRYSLGDVSGM